MIRMTIRVVIAAIFVSGLGACQEQQVYAPAPLQGGEVLNYALEFDNDAVSKFTIKFEKTDKGFTISDGNGFKAVKVGPDLMPDRRMIDIFDIGIVWLPPSLRQIGAKVHLGTVTEERKIDGRLTFLLNTRNGQEKRFYDAASGFLIKARTQGSHGWAVIQLLRSTIPGLKVGR